MAPRPANIRSPPTVEPTVLSPDGATVETPAGPDGLTGSLRLRSGQVSDEYFDKYLFEAQPDLPTVFVRKQAKEYGASW